MLSVDPTTVRLSPQALRVRLLDCESELAVMDVRAEHAFGQAHLLYASCLNYDHLEAVVDGLIPRRLAPIVVCDEGDGLAQLAAVRLFELDYTDVAVLGGGIPDWRAAGFELFSGVNVPSKAFGEWVEHQYQTPSLSADRGAGFNQQWRRYGDFG